MHRSRAPSIAPDTFFVAQSWADSITDMPGFNLRQAQRDWTGEAMMFRWAVICLVISLIAGGLGLTSVSVFAKRLSLIFFALFFLGFLALVGFAYLVSSAVYHSELLPALVAVSV
jgi:uncharacterized membrane protein YtjA (UPF0391 family)